MSNNLKNKTISAAAWRMAEMLCQRAGSLIVSIVLARLLMPEEFGTVALLTIFVSLANVVVNAGFGQALVQRQHTTPLEESSVYFCNIGMAVLLYGVLYLTAPFVPLFYNKPELTVLCPLLRLSALSLIIGSFGQVQTTLLTKQLHFKPLFVVSLIVLLAQAIVGIALAYRGAGVWALAWSTLIAGMVRVGLISWLSNWRPTFQFSFSALAPLFGFGWKLLASGLLDTFFVQIYGLLIGRFYAPADLGFFNRGKQIPDTVSMSLTATISSVLFPAMAQVQSDEQRMQRMLEKCLQFVAFLLWPCLVGLAFTADPLIRVLLTDKWLPAVPYMQVVSVTMCLYPVHAINLQVLTAIGRSDLFLKLEIIKKMLLVLILIITVPFGVMAMLYGELLLSFVALVINTYFTQRLIGYPLYRQIVAVRGTIGAVLMMGIVVGLMRRLAWQDDLVQLGAQAFAGATVYLAVAHLSRNPAYLELQNLVIERWNKLKGKRIVYE